MARDPLKEVLRMTESYGKTYNIPLKRGNFFKENRSIDLEHFGLTFMQRMGCFLTFLFIGIMCFVYSMFNILGAVFSPAKFALPYVISNLLFFSMMGFIFGFLSYMRDLLSKKKRVYTGTFLATTIITFYSTLKINNYFLNFSLAIIQVFSFLVFILTFFPGGTDGMRSMFKMVFYK
ncbi:Protein transport protein SFT2 [Astathelohania contejeani]|uniref:Protein transport protein SFT2 n=1 Tax=Astathelohania contejeani TaxID=164912 RepID=A0ABQ7I141_9MICR|nr:Protein transport protein SFT2 [Thelohania contejeani]